MEENREIDNTPPCSSEIVTILMDEHVSSTLVGLFTEVPPWLPTDGLRSLGVRKRYAKTQEGVRDVIATTVQKLSKPVAVTFDDVLDAAAEHLVFIGKGTGSAESAYLRFVQSAANMCAFQCISPPFELMEPLLPPSSLKPLGGTLVQALVGDPDPVEYPRCIWKCSNGVKLTAIGKGLPVYEMEESIFAGMEFHVTMQMDNGDELASGPAIVQPERSRVWANLTAFCSSRAMDLAVSEVKAAAKSAIRSFRLLRSAFGDMPPEDDKVEHELKFIATCLDAYFLPGQRGDTLDKRIHNAVHLLVQADGQVEPAVMLALSFSAIEALICSKREGIADELARNAATLLQHNPDLRSHTIKRAKKLYDLRSKVLHGSQTNVDDGTEVEARRLAAAILAATIGWTEFVSRLGESKWGKAEFFDALEEAKTTGKRFTGVPEETMYWLGWDKEG